MPRRPLGFTLIEILITLMLVGAFVPTAVRTFGEQSRRGRDVDLKARAVEIAEDGINKIQNAGAEHWIGLFKTFRTNPPNESQSDYRFLQAGTFTVGDPPATANFDRIIVWSNPSSILTSRDAYNEFLATPQTQGPPATFPSPDTDDLDETYRFQRVYVIDHYKEPGSEETQFLEGSVRVFFRNDTTPVPPDDEGMVSDVDEELLWTPKGLSLPVFIGNRTDDSKLRGIVSIPDPVLPDPGSPAAPNEFGDLASGFVVSPAGRSAWGQVPTSGTPRSLNRGFTGQIP